MSLCLSVFFLPVYVPHRSFFVYLPVCLIPSVFSHELCEQLKSRGLNWNCLSQNTPFDLWGFFVVVLRSCKQIYTRFKCCLASLCMVFNSQLNTD